MSTTIDAFIATWTASGGSERGRNFLGHGRAVQAPRTSLSFTTPDCPRTLR